MITERIDRVREEGRREAASAEMLMVMYQGAINSPDTDPVFVPIIAAQMV